MAINYELLNKGGISLGTNFELLSEKPLDSRLVVPSLNGLQNYIDNAAAYEGMIVYVSGEKKHYEVKTIDGVLSYRPFGLTEAELNDIITNATTAAMEFKGAAATLPENPAKGDMYKVAGENINIKIDDVDAKLGDSIVYDGEKWFLIPSGDDIEDTWRPVDGVNNDATLKFVDGDKTVAAVAADGTIKYNHATVATPVDVTAEGDEKTRTYITAVETDGYGHITGYKTATENVEDTNTTYVFEGQAEESSVYFQVTSSEDGADAEVVYLDAYSKNEANLELAKKVDKVEGYSLVSDTEIARLAEVDNYDDEEVRGLIGDNAQAIEDLGEYVGTIPNVPDADGNNKYADLDVIGYINKKAQETLAAAQGGSSETAASVKGQLDDYIGENNKRVGDVEDAIDAINNETTGILKQAKDYADGLAGNYDEAGAAAGVQAALEVEIAKKVDAVEGKSLIADTEIARLATLANYDDTQVKADIAQNASDIADNASAIAGIKNGANINDFAAVEASIEENVNAFAKAVEDFGLSIEKQYMLADEALSGRITTLEGASATHATKDELNGVDAKFASYKTAEAQKAIDDEQDRRLGVLEGASATHATKDELNGVDAKFADYTKTSDLPTDLGDFTNNAGYAKTADVNTELNKKADKTQVATDIVNAIAPLATTEALNGVKATAEAATTVEEVDAQIDAKISALNLGTTYEPIGAETRAKDYADSLITEANLGQYTTEKEVKDIVDGVIKTATSKETLDSLVEIVEYIDTHSGDAINMATAIGVLEGKVEVIEEKPAYDITATQISNWDNEVGAKALAGTKLDASAFTEYSNAHASDYTNKQIDDAIDADVAAAIEAEIARADDAYDANGAADYALEEAKADASNKDVVVLAEAQKYTDAAKAAAIADAAAKYEAIGTAQGIVDGLKLSETYEPIGAENRAIAAAEGKVNDLAKTLYTKDEVDALLSAAQTWGEF